MENEETNTCSLYYLLITRCLRYRDPEKLDLSNTLFIIGHTRERLQQKHAISKCSVHNHASWREKKRLESYDVEFIPELKFFQILIGNSNRGRNLNLIYHIFKNVAIRIIQLDLKFRDVILVIDQVFMEILIKNLGHKDVAWNVSFTESSLSKRPFWTYEVERQNSKATLVFFSGFSSLKVKGQREFPLEASLYSWQNYQVISKWQQDMIEFSLRGQNGIQVVNMGVPWFRDSNYEFPILKEPVLAVFDYQPRVNYFGLSTLNDLGLTSVETVVTFLKTTMEVCNKHNIRLLHKPKRNFLLSLSFPEYIETLNWLTSNSLYSRIPEETAPSRLIENAQAVVSLAPTTPGILASEMGVPSVFYDPTKLVDPYDPALSEVSVVSSMEDLEQWILENVSRKKGLN